MDNLVSLGIKGFAYSDLYDPLRLKMLTEYFYKEIETADPALSMQYADYRQRKEFSPVDESNLIVKLAPYLGLFIARLFQIEHFAETERVKTDATKPIFQFKKNFVIKHSKAFKPEDVAQIDLPKLDNQMRLLEEVIFGKVARGEERELSFATTVNTLMSIELALTRKTKGIQDNDAELNHKRLIEFCEKIRTHSRGSSLFDLPIPARLERDEIANEIIQRFLKIAQQWFLAHFREHHSSDEIKNWVSLKLPEKIDFSHLVKKTHPMKKLPELTIGPEENRRRRVGFDLTDKRFTRLQVLNEVNYCLFCHERDKDSCSKGFIDTNGKVMKNQLGIPLTGCPLDEKISEAHILKRDGETIAALATIMIDNPMLPATGHRICNDCMKGCIFQKQDPVNIPQIETRILTDCLDLPWGFEIYSLLTRWNPLNVKRPFSLPYNGKNVLVVGMGPAGFTLSQYLLNEGFGVIGVDGLKIEPLSKNLVGDKDNPPQPIRNVSDIYEPLDERIMAGFGGVAEYGITVRWNKNFLKLIYITLARRKHFSIYDGVRFGGTLTIDDAWNMGIDHIAIATGAGRPTVVDMKNNLIRGVRKASDFLMALQLTGAAKKSSMTNLQVRIPAIVIGGGLTAIDTSTELMAYYPVQVEKIRDRFEILSREFGEEQIWKMFSLEEKDILKEFLIHAKAIQNERERAEAAGERPDFSSLIKSWGGVSLVYRKSMLDSPAYRLNHEEIIKALEEGIFFIENMNPVECIPDEHGAVRAVTFERQKKDENGKLCGTGEIVTLSARSVLVAAGTTPNIIYEKEFPGSFKMDNRKKFFQKFEPKWNGKATPELVETIESDTVSTKTPSVFTSYQQDDKFISFFGDNHPIYAGNVVKAMASARKGYPYIVKLFEKEIKLLDPKDQEVRETRFKEMIQRLDDGLRPRVHRVYRLTPTIVEVVVKAPFQAQRFQPGQFYRLQNYETNAAKIDGTTLAIEGIALTGAWVDKKEGLLSLIVLELGHSSRLCASLREGEHVVVMGPTGYPTEIPSSGETVILAGGGLGNAVLFSIGKALRAKGNKVIYFAAYKKREDAFKFDDIEAASDVIVWSTDIAPSIEKRRPQDKTMVGNIVQAMADYAEGRLGETVVPFIGADRIIAIGSDRMMAAVHQARQSLLKPYFKENHVAIASINSMMQCMMKEVCAQCLQRHIDPKTGEQTDPVFSCFNQDQKMDEVDFPNLNSRLKQNSVQEKITNLWLDYLLKKQNIIRV